MPTAVNAGAYDVKAIGMGNYTGSLSAQFTVAKASQSISVAKSQWAYKAKSLAKKAVKFSLGAKAKAALRYAAGDAKSKKFLKITKKGKVTLKRGAKKGVYKIVVKVAESGNYLAASKTVKVKVK